MCCYFSIWLCFVIHRLGDVAIFLVGSMYMTAGSYPVRDKAGNLLHPPTTPRVENSFKRIASPTLEHHEIYPQNDYSFEDQRAYDERQLRFYAEEMDPNEVEEEEEAGGKYDFSTGRGVFSDGRGGYVMTPQKGNRDVEFVNYR